MDLLVAAARSARAAHLLLTVGRVMEFSDTLGEQDLLSEALRQGGRGETDPRR
jgi:hypothetical protein